MDATLPWRVIAEHERLLRHRDNAMILEVAHRASAAATDSTGESYRLIIKANRQRDRYWHFEIRLSEVEDRLCKLARNYDHVLAYVEKYYRSIGCWPTEAGDVHA